MKKKTNNYSINPDFISRIVVSVICLKSDSGSF